MAVTHAFVSLKTDGPDGAKVQASNWNDDHVFGGGSHGNLMVRDTGDPTGSSWTDSPSLTALALTGDATSSTGGFKAGTLASPLPARFTAAENITAHAYYGFQDYSVVSNPAPGLFGHASFSVRTVVQGSQDIDHHHGYQDSSTWSGSGTLTQMAGLHVAHVVTAGIITEHYGVRVIDPTMSGGAAITTNYGLRVYPLTSGGTNYAIYTSQGLVRFGDDVSTTGGLTATGAVAFSSTLAVTGASSLTGNVGIGVANAADRGLYIKPQGTLTGTSQYGALIFPTVSSAATTAAYGINLGIQTTAASYTITNAYGLNIISPVIGSGSAITTNHGLYVAAQTTGGTNYAIFTNAGLVRFGDNVSSIGSILSSSATAGIGYATGAGGTIGQGSGSGKATTVVLNKVTGTITMDAATLNANTTVSFTLTNSAIVGTDHIVLQHESGGTPGSYLLNGRPGTGNAVINVRNITAGNLSEAIVIRFTVIKAVSA